MSLLTIVTLTLFTLSLAAAFRRVRPPLAGTLRCRPGAEPHSPLALDPCSTRSAITAGRQPIESMVMGMKRAPYRLSCNTEAQRDIRHAVHHHPTILRYSLLVEDGGSYGWSTSILVLKDNICNRYSRERSFCDIVPVEKRHLCARFHPYFVLGVLRHILQARYVKSKFSFK